MIVAGRMDVDMDMLDALEDGLEITRAAKNGAIILGNPEFCQKAGFDPDNIDIRKQSQRRSIAAHAERAFSVFREAIETRLKQPQPLQMAANRSQTPRL